jgi:uncharacterized protein
MDAQTNPPPLGEIKQKKKGPPGALLFVPAALNRGAFLVWLKRIHAWTGFWGALAFLIVGSSGMLLNHRATLKIDTGAPREVMSADIAVDPTLIRSPEDLGKWAQGQFGLTIEPRAPRAEGGGGGQREGRRGGGRPQGASAGAPQAQAGERVELMGKEVKQAEVWKQSFNASNGVLNVEYVPGSASVKAAKQEQNVAGFIKNLHKGVGMSWVWILFIDTMAGGLIAMALTGALLWSRMHGPRLAAVGIVAGSLALGLFAALPNLV